MAISLITPDKTERMLYRSSIRLSGDFPRAKKSGTKRAVAVAGASAVPHSRIHHHGMDKHMGWLRSLNRQRRGLTSHQACIDSTYLHLPAEQINFSFAQISARYLSTDISRVFSSMPRQYLRLFLSFCQLPP
ncbi:Uncharacterized protein HZ326_0202 [Fusarium oxysporum f. sp. albedinis]|nr:Uncharacterized protein HZ326_0202 [Fusarium oxysporum f. sp. albedinis]